ncbi:hypothetical protein FRB99_000502 [Tulasnella sp. 403]|nr:hypothetical protein FRB99_000502 [Tulasnella sp. 403]
MFLHRGDISAIPESMLHEYDPDTLEYLRAIQNLPLEEDPASIPNLRDFFLTYLDFDISLFPRPRTQEDHWRLVHLVLILRIMDDGHVRAQRRDPMLQAFEAGLGCQGYGNWFLAKAMHRFRDGTHTFIKAMFLHINSYASIAPHIRYSSQISEHHEYASEEEALCSLREASNNSALTFEDLVVRFLQGHGPVNLENLRTIAERNVWDLPDDLGLLEDPGFRPHLWCQVATGGGLHHAGYTTQGEPSTTTLWSLLTLAQVQFFDDKTTICCQQGQIAAVTCMQTIKVPVIAIVRLFQMYPNRFEDACNAIDWWFLSQCLALQKGGYGMM